MTEGALWYLIHILIYRHSFLGYRCCAPWTFEHQKWVTQSLIGRIPWKSTKIMETLITRFVITFMVHHIHIFITIHFWDSILCPMGIRASKVSIHVDKSTMKVYEKLWQWRVLQSVEFCLKVCRWTRNNFSWLFETSTWTKYVKIYLVRFLV